MCNLSVFGVVCGKFPELFAHAQTVDTRPLFSPTTWPGYEATGVPTFQLRLDIRGSKYFIGGPYISEK